MQLSRNHRPTKTTGGPTVRSSIDAGLNLAGGAQKLSGPHRTRRKKPSRNKQKEPPRNHEEHLKNLLPKYIHLKQYLRVFSCSQYILFHRPRCSQSTSLTPIANQQWCSEALNHLLEERIRIQLDQRPNKQIFGQKNRVVKVCFRFLLFHFKQFLLALNES